MDYKSNHSKRYTAQEKAKLVLQIITGANTITGLYEETGIAKDTLIGWKKEFFNNLETVFTTQKEKNEGKSEKDKLIERQEKQIDLLKKLLKHYKLTQQGTSSRLRDSS